MINVTKGVPIRVPNQLLKASRFEIWSKGQLVDSGSIAADLWVEHLYPDMSTDGLQITVRIKDNNKDRIYKYILERFYFDVAYANDDRILVGIIPQESNIINSSSYDGFIEFAPFFTRESFSFENEMPFCCSLFFNDQSGLRKVTYSNGMNNTLIEFFS
ncbi:MAG: hypothetical protein ACJA1C_001196 [Crocinitomicaceae bacterium]|jgi:hypothetical protein